MYRHYVKFLSIGVITLCFASIDASRWSTTGNLNRARMAQETAGLTDGRIMVLGGKGDPTNGEIFDPANGTWIRSGIPAQSNHAMAILLPNGKVLYMAAEVFGTGNYYGLYDPFTSSWTASAVSLSWRGAACATLLRNSQLLMMYDGKNCRLYDYATDAVSVTGSSSSHHITGMETLLPDGRVLVAGGGSAYGDTNSNCEIYDPGAGTWSAATPTNDLQGRSVGVLLRQGQVLITGSSGQPRCELYDPMAETWTHTGDLNRHPREVAAVALIPSGEVLIVGGSSTTQYSCELYDFDTGAWTVTDNTVYTRSHFTVAILQTGKVLAIAGYVNPDQHARCEIYDPSYPSWSARPSLRHERGLHTLTPLPIIPTTNCSTNVLIAGGENSTGPLKSCELYNYSLEHVSLTGELGEARSHHTAVLLHSGQVLAVGGKNSTSAIRSCELYGAATETWTVTGNLNHARFDHTATLLKNGDVLVTGGESASGVMGSCEIYTGGIWISVSPMDTARTCHSTALLPDGRILVVGGKTSTGVATTCEIWDGVSWSATGSLATPRYFHTTILLQSGKVLAIGGTTDGSTPVASCEMYNPATGNWTHETDLNNARYLHNSTLIYSGLVLTTGGQDTSGYLSSCEIYDPALHQWKEDTTATLATPRAYHSSVLIPDTMPFVLAIGGTNGSYLNSIEEYDVGFEYRSAWQSTITNYPSVTHISDSMHIEGTLFRDITEADGGNYTHIASNDHPIISLVRIGGGNWQGNGGGEILHMPLSSSWNETHTTVSTKIGDFKGYYRLWSIVNGIPCKWYKECESSGVEEREQSTVHSLQSTVFPNPATHNTVVEFRVRSSEFVDKKNLTLKIYDLTGRLVRSCPIDNSRLKIHGLDSGIYFYRISPVTHVSPVILSKREESHTITGKFTVVE